MIRLTRSKQNPLIRPNKKLWWEAVSIFNAGVVLDNGKVHMLYRALGGDRISRFGYASSQDGLKFTNFKDTPVFESDPFDEFERLGCEDPRITKIGDTFYIVYCSASVHPATYPTTNFSTSFAPWRVRVSMLSTKDFLTFIRHGVLIPSADSKDGTLFPEKINNQYVLLHRIWPDIWIAFSDNLKEWYDHKVIVKTRENSWDSSKVGAGAPPIKTDIGWLLFYHGADHKNVYRLGILVLDLDDPTKVLYRSKRPILEPEKGHERKGFVNNVVFTCGAIEKEEKYLVYYGAADNSICMASIDKKDLLGQIEEEINKD